MHVLLWLVIAYFGALAFMLAARWLDGEMAEFHKRERERQRAEELRRQQRNARYGMPQWIRNGLALIRHAHAADIVDSIISVQPMSHRTGRIHYLDVMMCRGREVQLPDPETLTPEQKAKRAMLAQKLLELTDQVRQELGLERQPRRAVASWSLESEEQLKSLWGLDASNELIARGLEASNYEAEREVRNHLIAMSAVEEAFAGWELRERYREPVAA